MTELRDFNGSDISITVNARLKGIEIVFNDKMTDEIIAEIKDAGFRWSKRQQKWWAYQSERANAYAASLAEKYNAKEIRHDSDEQKAIPVKEAENRAAESTAKKADKNKTPFVKDIFSGTRHTQGQMRRIREEAKRILAGNTDEEICANPEMLGLLAQYEGGGGISGEGGRTAAEVLNAFYTPREVAAAAWKLAEHYVPNARTVLEPSAGIGRFAEKRDGDIEFTLRELDETSARIAKILHPKANVIQGAFQEQFFDESGRAPKKNYEPPKYDLVIGNPPYGENRSVWAGRGEGKEFARLEEYFVSRGVDSLKDGNSALVFVMPSGFLKGFPDRAKRVLSEKCALVDAYRLPNGAFDTTDIGTDIVVLRKGSCRAEDISSDSFFRAHPEKILGEEYSCKDRFGKEVSRVRPRGANTLKDELDKISELLEKEGQSAAVRPSEESVELPREEENHSEQKDALLTRASEIPSAQFAVDGEASSPFEDNLAWLVETLGCDEERTRPVLERLYSMKLKFRTHGEAYERSKAIPLAFGHEHPDAPWVDGEGLENIIGIFDERLDYHTVWDRSWAARQGMAREDIARLIKWDYNAPNRLIKAAGKSKGNDLFPEHEEKIPKHIFAGDAEERNEHEEAEEKRATALQKGTAQTVAYKLKGDTLTAQEFARLYGKKFSESEFNIWKATDWEGRIDFSKLDDDEKKELLENSNYAEIEPDVWTHRELFVSGDIRKKIHEYEKKLSALDETDSRSLELYKKNIEILKDILPKNIPINKLHFGVNTTLAEEFKIKHQVENGKTVKLNLQESFILWAQGETYQSRLSNESYYRSGIDFATANISLEEFPENVEWHDIVEYIDKKPVKAISTHKRHNMTDEEVEAERAQRKREAEEKRMARAETADRLFDKFLHEGLSENDRRSVEAEYNSRFNSYKVPDYSKLPLFVDGMSAFKGDDRFRLYDQQIKSISFLSNKGNGLLAYDVGVGKTAAGIVANVNQIQLGRSSRPLIVVPNSVYTKWYDDIKELFPNVQVNDLYNFNKESIKNFRDGKNPHKLNIPKSTISLCTYEALTQNITFTDESCENTLYEDFSKLLSEDLDGNATENAKDAEKIKNAIGSASQVKNSNFVFFEKCGFDNITVDEAHNFKNLWTVPRPKKKGQSNEFFGIPSGKPSQRALKLYAMTQLVQRENDSRNVFLLTATPFTNSPLEVYSMLSYIGRQRLIDSGIHSLRDFCNQFAHTKLEIAVNAHGAIDYKQVMKDWNELPALQNILTEYIDKVDGEEAKIIRPRKFTHVKDLDLTPTQKKMIEADTEHMLEVKEGNSAAVIVSMNAMRLALVAPALTDKSRYPGVKIPPMEKLVETSPKLKFVCDSIIDMHRTNPEKGQFMYMPLGQQSHGIVKDYLIAHGIPKDAVEIINGSTNNSVEKKENITKRFNDAKNKLKIIIGGKNTSEGIDLNGNSFVMYNCSLGWNPSETVQAEGRIWRQGNLQGHVHCVYPVMNDSIDSVLYQKHDEKLSRIGDLWSYKGENLNVEDIRPEDLKFDLIKDPMKRANLILDEDTKELKAELSKTELRIKSYDRIVEKRIELKKQLDELDDTLDRHKHLKKQYEESDDLEIPEWLKSEIKVTKLGKKCASDKMDAVNEKLEKMGIKSEADFAKYVRNLNARKHELEKQIKMKESELPSIISKLRLELNEKKITIPPVEEQRKELCDEILSNMRPMKEVEFEIKTERFEKTLERKFQSGEITAEERNRYSSAGYANYEKWLVGEIESLEKIPDEKLKREESSNEISDTIKSKISDEKKSILINSSREEFQGSKTTDEKTMQKSKSVSKKSAQMSLFTEEELDALSQKKPKEPPKKNFRLIAYMSDSGFSERGEFGTRQEASDAGLKFMRDWELSKNENGFVVYDAEEKRIGGAVGTFNPHEYFSEEILALNGMFAQKNLAPREVKISDFANAVREVAKGRTDTTDERPKARLVVGGIPKAKKRAGMER